MSGALRFRQACFRMPRMSAQIRLAQIDDAASLAALARETFIDTYAAFNTVQDMNLHLERSYSPEIQRSEISNVSMLTILAAEPDRLIGFSQLQVGTAPACLAGRAPAPQHPWEILRFYLHRDAHGKGVAQALMERALLEARTRGADALWLSVWSRNPRAQAFYRKCGFVVAGDTTFTLGRDVQHDFVMCRSLSLPA